MGKSKKKGSGGGGTGQQEGKKLGHRKQRQLEQRQRKDNERRADEALAAGIKKLGISDDSDLFAPIKLKDDCPICLVPLPLDDEESIYFPCCGKLICTICKDQSAKALGRVNALRASKKQDLLPSSCAFCRTSWAQPNVYVGRVKELIELKNDPVALLEMSSLYKRGRRGVIKDEQKALDLMLQAVELGYTRALNRLALEYCDGIMLERDEGKARACFGAAAKGGHYLAHSCLGELEYKAGNMKAASKHRHLAAAVGDKYSLDKIQHMHSAGLVTNVEFTNALRAYQDASIEYKREETSSKKKK